MRLSSSPGLRRPLRGRRNPSLVCTPALPVRSLARVAGLDGGILTAWNRIGLLFLLLALAGCLNEPVDRVANDRRVGHAELAGVVRVDLDDGLATVREMTPTGVRLWAQAPEIAGVLVAQAGLTAPWRITLENALPDADLSATVDGSPVTATPVAGARPTQRIWEFPARPDGPVRFWVTAPDTDDGAPYRVAYVSDIHHGEGPLAELLERINASATPQNAAPVRFVLCGGDLTHRGTQAELDAFLADLTALHVPFFTAAGNHDVGWDTADVWAATLGRANFHFAFRGVHFTVLDSADATVHPTAFRWLRAYLDAGSDAPHVFVTHIPPLDPVGERNAGFSSRLQAQRLLAALAAAGVDLTLYGHIHSYYAFTNAGIPAHIAGGGISEGERGDGVGPHYLTLDLDPSGTTKPAVTLVRLD